MLWFLAVIISRGFRTNEYLQYTWNFQKHFVECANRGFLTREILNGILNQSGQSTTRTLKEIIDRQVTKGFCRLQSNTV